MFTEIEGQKVYLPSGWFGKAYIWSEDKAERLDSHLRKSIPWLNGVIAWALVSALLFAIFLNYFVATIGVIASLVLIVILSFGPLIGFIVWDRRFARKLRSELIEVKGYRTWKGYVRDRLENLSNRILFLLLFCMAIIGGASIYLILYVGEFQTGLPLYFAVLIGIIAPIYSIGCAYLIMVRGKYELRKDNS